MKGTSYLTLLNLALGLGAIIFTSATTAQSPKNIYGRIEYVTLEDQHQLLKAKMDTGARISSLSAINIEFFTKNKKNWVQFDVVDPKKNIKMHFEKPLERMLHIKPRKDEILNLTDSAKTDLQNKIQRPVVKMEICLRNQLKEIEVNLIDRLHLLYPMLLGSKAIVTFDGIINPASKFTERPSCNSLISKSRELKK